MTAKVFIKEHTREYSMIRVEAAINRIYRKMEAAWGIKKIEAVAVCRQGGLVSVYYTKESWLNVFEIIAQKASDINWLNEQVKQLFEHFEKLLPYFRDGKTPKDLTELKEVVWENYTEAYFRIGVVYVVPLIESLPEETRKIALAAREKVQEYNESIEETLIRTIEFLYPKLKDGARFITWDELCSDEVNDFAKISEKINRRKQGFVFYDGQFYDGEVDKTITDLGVTLSDGAETTDSKTIKGEIGFKGFAKGAVKLIYTEKDLGKINEGDIIVAPMTMPDFLPGMKKAAAFVTDEGGITCHAAIVAREMQKPCVLATKIATKLLKDGDMVEVDADRGIVTILEKSK